MKPREEPEQQRIQWRMLSLYERFEHAVVSTITLLIAVVVVVATWQLVLSVFALAGTHPLVLANFDVFQAVFGMILTVLIALEFKHSLFVIAPGRRDPVHVQSVVLIALLALVRKFILLDIHTTTPSLVAALAGAALALGVVYWLIAWQEHRGVRDATTQSK